MIQKAIPVLHITNGDAAEAFYCGQLGFRVEFEVRGSETGRDPCYLGVSRDGQSLHLSSHAGDGIAGGVVLFLCDEVDRLHGEFAAKDTLIHMGPVDQTWGMRELYVRDPDGNSVRFAAPVKAGSADKSDEPCITTTTAQLTAKIRLTVPRSEIRSVMGPGLGELKSAVAAQGIAVTGPWFDHHFRMDPAVFDFEICVPVAEPIVAVGRVEPGIMPAARVARTIYRGPYEGLAKAWSEFEAWIAAAGFKSGPELSQCFVVGPETSANPLDWRTELTRPLLT